MLELKQNLTNAILVNLDFGHGDYHDRLHELQQLALSADLVIAGIVEGKRARPDATTFIGSGKVEEIAQLASNTNATLVVFNHDLSPAQQRNLSVRLKCNVVERTSLILDIFAQHNAIRTQNLKMILSKKFPSLVNSLPVWQLRLHLCHSP